MSEISQHLGQRIRMYRKLNHLTLEQLADKIHKNKSTLSKYEKGEIGVDVETLYEISCVLEVSISQLTDCEDLNRNIKKDSTKLNKFFCKRPLYLYWYDGKKDKINFGILEINTNEQEAILYVGTPDLKNYMKSKYICCGEIQTTGIFTRCTLINQINSIDTVTICLFNPTDSNDYICGLMLGIDALIQLTSHKCVLSGHVLKEDNELKEMLIFSKEELKDIKRYNKLTVSLN
ncbi:MAG: helix-turn-helix domain-containing protein [Clostridiaceae bacterium]